MSRRGSFTSLSPASTSTFFEYSDAEHPQKFTSSSSPYPPQSHKRPTTWIPLTVRSHRRKFLAIAASLFVLASLAAFVTFANDRVKNETIVVSQPSQIYPGVSHNSPKTEQKEDDPPPTSENTPGGKAHFLDLSTVINGPPSARFRDNLKPNLKYLTTWISAGWTNDVMTYGNMLYLALITERIPIIPMFTPSHIGGHVPPIPFGEVFDVPRLREALGVPILEWREVKDPESEELDDIGCWNTWEAVQYREARPRDSAVPFHLSLDISYTRAPDYIKLIPNFEHDQHTTFWSLATLAYPEGRNANLRTPSPSPVHNVSLPPDEQLLCFDYMYYVCAHQPFEWEKDYSPAWRFVGQHMRWTEPLEALAEYYVRNAMGITLDDEPTPPYISIHIRHGDFANYCGDIDPKDCFASIPTIARRVKEVKDEIWEKKKLVVKHVIMLSDERDEEWWNAVERRGWLTIDHTHTGELYGDWYPLLIDAVIQSGGHGFVGTDRSTMSVLAARRVESWRDGVTRMLKWGTPDADAH